jgi:hypothetical protein
LIRIKEVPQMREQTISKKMALPFVDSDIGNNRLQRLTFGQPFQI